MYTTINNFDSVELVSDNTLIICDIDNTLLYFYCDKDDSFFLEIIKDMIDPELSVEEKINQINKEIRELKLMYQKINNSVKCTDFEGFLNLQEKIKNTNSELILLTARNSSSDTWTRKNIKDIGLNCDDIQIHYTNDKISKGEYIKNNLKLESYSDIIFIDDYECYIQKVIEFVPQSRCYKFEIKSN